MSEHTPHIEPVFNNRGSWAAEYFDRLYAHTPDPWEFETSLYEIQKYAATLAALPRKQYRRGLELGCSIGVLTRALAQRCEHLLATDIAEVALTQARNRCGDLPHVSFEQRDVTTQFPHGRFDLIVLSEVGYYLSPSDLRALREHLVSALPPAGHLLLVHYTGPTNYPLTGDVVHEAFLNAPGSPWIEKSGQRHASYRLDLLERI